MRRRSGGLHCETEEQLLELASNNQIGIYYNERPLFKEIKFQKQWTINEAQNTKSQMYQNFDFSQQEEQAKEQQKQLNKAKRYLNNCVVDQQKVRFSIQICIITPKIQQIISNILKKDALLDLFVNNKKTPQTPIFDHSTITSFPNSNVFSLETTNFDSSHIKNDKENIRMTPKNWLKQNKSEKMIQLLIVKKHIWIDKNTQKCPKKITITHRIFIVNEKYLQNPLIKIYLQKSHYVIDTRAQTLKQKNDPHNKSNNLYDKLFHHHSFLNTNCKIFNRGDYCMNDDQHGETYHFRDVFHLINGRIIDNQLQSLNEIFAKENRKSPQKDTKMRR